MKNCERILFLTVLLLSILPVHRDSLAQDNTQAVLDISTTTVPQFDPLLASDETSTTVVENLFLGLTDIDPITGQIMPELADDWTVSENGLTWTFNLRSDVNWVQYDPATGQPVPVRPVVANDFVYGIKRACDPRIEATHYGYTVADYIAGCGETLWAAPDSVTDELVFGDTVKVTAPNDTTLVVELSHPVWTFPGLATLPALRAVPVELLQEYGTNWTPQMATAEANCTVSSGNEVNLRTEPSASAERAGGLTPNENIAAVAQSMDNDGYVWWMLKLDDGTFVYVRSDVVSEQGGCDTLPDVANYDPNAVAALLPPFMSNGPYALVNDGTLPYTFVRNYDLPSELQGDGNIDVVTMHLVNDVGILQSYYVENVIDSTLLQPDDLDNLSEFGGGVVHTQREAVGGMFVFDHTKPPFDNVYVRRAFSSILNRRAFIDQVRQGRGVPMVHLIPYNTPGGPADHSLDSLDFMDFNPEIAFMSLAQAGYPGCEGFPEITLANLPATHGWGEFWKQAAEEYLGCDPEFMNVETLEFSSLVLATQPGAPVEDRPNVWTLSWGAEYGDANNWMAAVPCGEYASSGRACTGIDDLIEQAAYAAQEERSEMYAEVEEAFFGPDGEFPIAPIYLRSDSMLFKTWYTGPFETDGLYGGEHWGAQSVDMEAKLAARGN